MYDKKIMAFNAGIELLKYFYQSDLTAMSQIVTAEVENDYKTVKEYMECVVDYCETIKNAL